MPFRRIYARKGKIVRESIYYDMDEVRRQLDPQITEGPLLDGPSMQRRDNLTMAHSSATQDPRPASSLDIHELPEALQVPTKSVSFGFPLLLCLANTVFWLGLLPVGQILLPTQVAAIDAVHKVS